MNTYTLENGIATITMDDGKVNVVNVQSVEALLTSLDKAKAEADLVVLRGRQGQFCAGFDLKLFQTGDLEKMRNQAIAGFTLLNTLAAFPLPLIAVCEGNALGMGAFFLLASDVRIGADINCKIGLPETAASMPMEPSLLVDLAKDRLTPSRYLEAALMSRMYAPKDAIDAGFIDLVAPEAALEQTIAGAAAQLKQLPKRWYQHNKALIKKRLIDDMERSLAQLKANPTAMFAE